MMATENWEDNKCTLEEANFIVSVKMQYYPDVFYFVKKEDAIAARDDLIEYAKSSGWDSRSIAISEIIKEHNYTQIGQKPTTAKLLFQRED